MRKTGKHMKTTQKKKTQEGEMEVLAHRCALRGEGSVRWPEDMSQGGTHYLRKGEAGALRNRSCYRSILEA